MGFKFDPAGQGDLYLFHYTTMQGLAGILDSKCFRMSCLSQMNDPRESRTVSLSYSESADGKVFPPGLDRDEFQQRLVTKLRDTTFVASFTTENEEVSEDGQYTRGYSRARNWAQYGERHQGACLVFDRSEFVRATERLTAPPGENIASRCRSGSVTDEDSQSVETPIGWLTLKPTDVGDGSNQYVDAMLASLRLEHADSLFFRKNTDWQSEREYRVVVWAEGKAPKVPINSLVGIVVGEAFPNYERSVLSERVRGSGIEGLRVGYMNWTNGIPGASPCNVHAHFPGF